MLFEPKRWPVRVSISLLLLASVLLSQPARAQAPAGSSATERLIELLVQKGILPRDQAAGLLAQAQQEARPASTATRKARQGSPVAAPAAQPSSGALPAGSNAATVAGQGLSPDTVRVTYVPETVRNQIAAQVRKDVMTQAKNEGWATPNATPEWVQRISMFGDLRLRGEADMFQNTNYPNFVDFNAINNSAGFDTNGGALPPLLNSTQNRTRFRLRARLGVDAQIDDNILSEIRIATGNDNSPVSTNQTMGVNGAFNKYAIWIDRAFIKGTPADWATLFAGRMPNPFWTTDLMYYDDLGFDGVAAQVTPRFDDHWSGFFNAGFFPVLNTALNFGSTSAPGNRASHDAYLIGGQAGANWKISDDFAAKAALGYFAYTGVQGQTSSPCQIIYSSDTCSTDNTRPQFLQFGNTVFPIRNIVPNPSFANGGPMPQYYGLASRFGVLDVHARVDISTFNPIGIALEGDYSTNLSYSRNSVASRPPANNFDVNNQYKGGNNTYLVRVTVGTAAIEKRWDWNVFLTYKYLETDAVLDALNDPDFHLGGTNAKGFILGGNLGLARNTYLTTRFLSANQVSGPPYAIDVIQADLNVKF